LVATPPVACGSLELAFTMNEGASILRVSRRKLQDLIKDHPHFYLNGNRKLFSESDIVALREAMRAQAEDQRNRKWRSSSNRPARAKARITQSGGHTSVSAWTKAQE